MPAFGKAELELQDVVQHAGILVVYELLCGCALDVQQSPARGKGATYNARSKFYNLAILTTAKALTLLASVSTSVHLGSHTCPSAERRPGARS